MSIVSDAPKKIVWRGIEYYKQNKVIDINEDEKGCYSAKVIGSGKNTYSIFINLKHPKKSTCSCPFTKDNDVICKHMVAVYFAVKPKEIKLFEEDERRYIEDKDYRREKDKEKLMVFARKMSKEELVEALAECWLQLESYRQRDI